MKSDKGQVIKFKLLKKGAKIPSYAHKGDAGIDLYSDKSKTLKKGSHDIFPLGIASKLPEGYFVSFRDRSGLAKDHGVHVLGGVVDSSYRGEWKVILANFGPKDYKVAKGERIAQGILQPAPQAEIVKVKRLGRTQRGKKGFGSTGKK